MYHTIRLFALNAIVWHCDVQICVPRLGRKLNTLMLESFFLSWPLSYDVSLRSIMWVPWACYSIHHTGTDWNIVACLIGRLLYILCYAAFILIICCCFCWPLKIFFYPIYCYPDVLSSFLGFKIFVASWEGSAINTFLVVSPIVSITPWVTID